jgi:phosphoribosylglycinamide formyltransferase-1
MAVKKLKIGIQVSGRGSNLQALIDACRDPDFPAEIVLVLSNVADAFALTRAAEAGLAVKTIPHKNYPSREAFEDALDAAHHAAGVELVCNAGFMRILTPHFVGKWQGRMINIHPSLLPAFPGLDTHRRALEAGVKVAGCTVHFVEAEVDAGAILVQAGVPVLPDDDEGRLAARILAEEHKAYPLAVRLIAEGRAVYDKGKIRWNGQESFTATGLLNPP